MSEINEENKKIYLDLCEQVWDFDSSSMDYLKSRLSDDWKPVEDFNDFLKLGNFEDQRIKINLDLKNEFVQNLFEKDDESYSLFKTIFSYALDYLKSTNVNITYENFCSNKIIYKKNVTKIKKVLESVYKSHPDIFEKDGRMTEKDCADWIVKMYEKIGASKKPFGKMKFVISFNPIDWLLSSTAEKWSSCFNINNKDGGYQYCLGLPFLAGDKNRVMFYITDETKKEFNGIKVDHFTSRCWALVDKSGTINIVKWYPNNVFSSKTISGLLGCDKIKSSDNFTQSKYNIDILSTIDGAVIGVYSDMGEMKVTGDEKLKWFGNNKKGQQIFSKNLVNLSKTDNSFTENITGGYTISEWLKSGKHLDIFNKRYKCNICKSQKITIKNSDGRHFCTDCYKKEFCLCCQCNNSFPKNEITEIVFHNGEKLKVCKDCIHNFLKCSYCGKYHYTIKLTHIPEDNKYICEDCLSAGVDGYSECSNCGKITKTSRIVKNPFDKSIKMVCNNCDDEVGYGYSIFGKRFIPIVSQKRAELNV